MSMAVGIFGGGGSNSGGGGGGASAADKALVQNATQYGLSHNLYKVMEEVKKDPRTSGYAAIMLCQYYKGFYSLALKGGANAFLTSDGDFYQGNTTHVWHDYDNGYIDRWVAMLFSDTGGTYTCSDAAASPRAALIDGTMGNIVNTTGNRLTWVDVTEGSSWGQIKQSYGAACSWNKQLVLRGMRLISTATAADAAINMTGAINAVVGVKQITSFGFNDSGSSLTEVVFEGLERIDGTSSARCLFVQYGQSSITSLKEIVLPDLVYCGKIFQTQGSSTNVIGTNLQRIVMPKCTELIYFSGNGNAHSSSSIGYASLIRFEIGQGFYSDLNLRMCTFANCIKTDANDLVEDVVAHPTWSNLDQWLYNFEHLIVDKLADLSGQTAKTITLAATPYAAITSEIRAKMSAKNWNLASA